MRDLARGVWLAGVVIGMVGCGATRSPQVVIAPSYSYVQSDLAAGTSTELDLVDAGQGTVLASVSNKLPPIPAAPGFDTLVMGPVDGRVE